jgi:hypothetical protein
MRSRIYMFRPTAGSAIRYRTSAVTPPAVARQRAPAPATVRKQRQTGPHEARRSPLPDTTKRPRRPTLASSSDPLFSSFPRLSPPRRRDVRTAVAASRAGGPRQRP